MKSSRGSKKRGDDCLLRVPFASLIASLLCAVGISLFAIMIAWSFNASVQVFFIVITIIMAVAIILLLIVGTLSTGSTRDDIYSGVKGQLGGRIANALAMLFTYMLNICWLICLIFIAIFCFIYYIFTSLCASLSAYSDSNCIDFGIFRPLFQKIPDSSSLRLCGGRLIHFLICCAANYAHVTSGRKYEDLREVIEEKMGPLLCGLDSAFKIDLRAGQISTKNSYESNEKLTKVLLLASEDIDGGMSEIRRLGIEGPPRPGSRWARSYSPYRH
uniref:Tetraspanin n=1 Tax=Parascaris equorum TaxID=6256 RepID=A0A914RIW2_PAREQ